MVRHVKRLGEVFLRIGIVGYPPINLVIRPIREAVPSRPLRTLATRWFTCVDRFVTMSLALMFLGER